MLKGLRMETIPFYASTCLSALFPATAQAPLTYQTCTVLLYCSAAAAAVTATAAAATAAAAAAVAAAVAATVATATATAAAAAAAAATTTTIARPPLLPLLLRRHTTMP